jgi:regulatory protein
MKQLRMSSSSTNFDLETDPYSVALTIALSAIGRRAMSRGQLSDYLNQRGAPDLERDAVLIRVEEMGYINDLDFARATCERMRRTKKVSKRALVTELKSKKIEQEIIDWVIEDYSDEQDLELAAEFAEKKWRSAASIDPEKLRRRIAAALLRKGFTNSIAMEVTKSLR